MPNNDHRAVSTSSCGYPSHINLKNGIQSIDRDLDSIHKKIKKNKCVNSEFMELVL